MIDTCLSILSFWTIRATCYSASSFCNAVFILFVKQFHDNLHAIMDRDLSCYSLMQKSVNSVSSSERSFSHCIDLRASEFPQIFLQLTVNTHIFRNNFLWGIHSHCSFQTKIQLLLLLRVKNSYGNNRLSMTKNTSLFLPKIDERCILLSHRPPSNVSTPADRARNRIFGYSSLSVGIAQDASILVPELSQHEEWHRVTEPL